MGPRNHDPERAWTEAELVLVQSLFKRLFERGCAPVMIFAVNEHADGFAAFNPGLEPAEAELLGVVVEAVMKGIQNLRQ